MYVLKVGSMYFTGSSLSEAQRDAKRFLGHLVSPDLLVGLFGADARFVRLRSRV